MPSDHHPPDRLRSLDPPWVELRVLRPGRAWVPPSSPGDFVARTVHGGRCRTKGALLAEFARVFEFPPHFGQTWDALEDCLTDLEWLPAAGYLVVVPEAHRLLARHDEDYSTFVAILEAAGQEWARGRGREPRRAPRPFHAVLTVPAGHRAARKDWRVPVMED